MLFARHTRFFARAFVDGKRLGPTATNFRIVSEALGDEGMLPAQVAEPGGDGPIPRIAFMDSTGFQVIVGSESIYAQHIPAGNSLNDFVVRASSVFEHLLPLLPQQATRIAFIQEGQVVASHPDDVARALFRFPPSLASPSPFEWDWRCATKIGRRFHGRDEETNTVVTVRRFAGKLAWGEPFDGLLTELDINTTQENAVPRFGAADCRAFFEASVAWHSELASELEEFIGHGGQA